MFQFVIVNDLMYIYILLTTTFVNIETLLESFLSIYFIIYLSLYFPSHLAARIQKVNLSSGLGS